MSAPRSGIVRLFKNAAVLLTGNAGASVLGLVSLVITARTLGPSVFGALSLILTFVAVAGKLADFQSWQAIIKYASSALENNDKNNVFALLKIGFALDIAAAAVGAALSAAIVPVLGRWFGWTPEQSIMAAGYSATILFNMTGAPIATLRMFGLFRLHSTILIISSVLKLIAVSVGAAAGVGLKGYLIIYAFSDISLKLLLLLAALHELRARGYFALSSSSALSTFMSFPGLWRFLVTTNLSSSFRVVSKEVDILVVGGVLGGSAVGVYKVAKQVPSAMAMLIDPLYQAIYPELSRLVGRSELTSVRKLVEKASSLVALVGVAMWVALSFVSESLLALLFGSEYVSASVVMLWYSMGVVVSIVGFPLQPIMLALGRPGVSLYVHVISTTLYAGIMVLLVTLYGLEGAGLSYLAYCLLWTLLMTVMLQNALCADIERSSMEIR